MEITIITTIEENFDFSYYTMIFSQSAADLLQGGMVITWMTVTHFLCSIVYSNLELLVSYKIRWNLAFLCLLHVDRLSCRLLDGRSQPVCILIIFYLLVTRFSCKLLKKTLFVILGATGTPAVIMSVYLIIRKNSSHEVTSAEVKWQLFLKLSTNLVVATGWQSINTGLVKMSSDVLHPEKHINII